MKIVLDLKDDDVDFIKAADPRFIQGKEDHYMKKAIEYCEKNYSFSYDLYEKGYCAILNMRPKNTLLPEMGYDGSDRDSNDYAYIDLMEKMDTGIYGAIYYFSLT